MTRIICLLAACYLISCDTPVEKQAPGTLGYDIEFLQGFDSVVILESGDSRVIVSPKYQAKVFTSGAGTEGQSFGWINYKAFTAKPDPHINAYGGENRLWLGPEGGVYSLFFKPADSMVFGNWHTPAPVDTEPWKVVVKSTRSVSMNKDMELLNYAGSKLSIGVYRTISILSLPEIESFLACPVDSAIRVAGYRTQNTISNKGTLAWNERTGMPCLWLLDMFPPSDHTTIVIPFKGNVKEKPATTDYFGEMPVGRIKLSGNTLFYKADGKMRGKLGIHPARATNVAGSYDADKKILTIILFDIDNNAKYLNQEWKTSKPPFSGDAVNAYNDGPLTGGGQLGPFYELESVSPPASLQPGGSLTHTHSVFHFTGKENALDAIARKVLGVSIEEIKKAF